MAKKFLPLNETLYNYILDNSLREPEILNRLREETSTIPMSVMQISPDQGQFLSLLVKLINAKKSLEVGVFTGYSSLCIASALPTEGKHIACDINEEWTAIARRYWEEAGLSNKIDLRIAPAIETLDNLLANGEAGSFDLIFIDADKANYDNYYERALKLVRTGGLIAIDNVLWSGKVVTDDEDKDTVAIKALNKKLYSDERVLLSLLTIADGLTLVYKR
jgi:predicted O-methyltransferase YrrM